MKYALVMKQEIGKVNEEASFPMRINKYMAQKGYSTRRGADALIERGLITLNGKRAVLGDLVNEGDEVIYKEKGPKKDYQYFAFNKPRGIITHSPQGDEEDIAAYTEGNRALDGMFPVGRLDKASHGLIILTNDGRITDRLLSPKKVHEKEYIVETHHKLRPSFSEHMSKGVQLEDCVTKPCKINVTGETIFRIALTEGKKHQIRRMVSAMHNEVKDIKRVRIMNIKLAGMKEGSCREIVGDELKEFLLSLGLPA
jgi:23S rRNA pseudouridine2604 synthase